VIVLAAFVAAYAYDLSLMMFVGNTGTESLNSTENETRTTTMRLGNVQETSLSLLREQQTPKTPQVGESPFLTVHSATQPCEECWKAEHYHLRHCFIPKTSSTNMINLLLRLNNITTDLLGHTGIDKVPKSSSGENAAGWVTIAVYREPHERILSAYLDTNAYNECRNKDFATFVMKHLKRSIYTNAHFQLQTLICPPKTIDYLVDYHQMAQGVQSVLKQVGAWETHGASGWGENGREPFLGVPARTGIDFPGSTRDLLGVFYTDEMWNHVNKIFADDLALFPDNRARTRSGNHTAGDFESVRDILLQSKGVVDECVQVKRRTRGNFVKCGCYERLALLENEKI
jgi:hypothetical protein